MELWALAAAILLLITRAFGWVDDNPGDPSLFWLSIVFFFMHFAWPIGFGDVRARFQPKKQ